jgi:limonene 1,2-monooxygenase
VIDAFMRGIDPRENRPRMAASLEVIMRLLRGERVTMETDWFRLQDAHLHLAPYSRPHFEVAVAALISPSGPALAARLGCSLLSMGATLVEGYKELNVHWQVMEEVSAAQNLVPDRSGWRLLGPMHLGPTREQAMREVEHGLPQWLDYHERVANLPIAPAAASAREAAELVNDMSVGVIGTPEDAAAQLARLVEQSGGFGTYLFLAHDWADREATLRSFRLFAEQVMPELQGRLQPLRDSWDWAIDRKPAFLPQAQAAIMDAVTAHYGADHARTRHVKNVLDGDPSVGGAAPG